MLRAQAEQHQTNSEHSIDAEQRGVSMYGSGVETLHVIERDGRIDEKSEQAGADKIPECDRDKEIDWPAVIRKPGGCLGKADIFPGFKSDQDQRHHFERAE